MLEVLVQRFEQRVPPERFAAALDVRLKCLRARITRMQMTFTKIPVQKFQYLALDGRNADIVDQRRGAQR